MLLFEIALPLADNSGATYEHALAIWEDYALKRAGGFTALPEGRGSWRDPADQKVYNDVMRPYRVACNRAVFGLLVADAFRLFPDQVALYTVAYGNCALIVERPTHV